MRNNSHLPLYTISIGLRMPGTRPSGLYAGFANPDNCAQPDNIVQPVKPHSFERLPASRAATQSEPSPVAPCPLSTSAYIMENNKITYIHESCIWTRIALIIMLQSNPKF